MIPIRYLSTTRYQMKYATEKKQNWILNGGIDKEWDSYLKKMEQYGLSDYLAIKQKYFDHVSEVS